MSMKQYQKTSRFYDKNKSMIDFKLDIENKDRLV